MMERPVIKSFGDVGYGAEDLRMHGQIESENSRENIERGSEVQCYTEKHWYLACFAVNYISIDFMWLLHTV